MKVSWKDHELYGSLPPLRRTAFAIIFLLFVYGIIAAFGIPQYWTHLANEKHEEHEHLVQIYDTATGTDDVYDTKKSHIVYEFESIAERMPLALTPTQDRNEAGNLVLVFADGELASSKTYQITLTKSESRDVVLTYGVATGINDVFDTGGVYADFAFDSIVELADLDYAPTQEKSDKDILMLSFADGDLEAGKAYQITLKKTEKVLIPPIFTVIPFALLLLAIAFLPLIPAAEHWWHSNLNKFYVAGTLGVITLLYYGFFSNFTIEGHWPAHFEIAPDASALTKISTIFGNAIIYEFIPFIVLLFALYVIAGGIRIEGNFRATPMVNAMILSVGAIIASFVGTTGAAMLLIRLLLDVNRQRKHKVHLVVFFIFIVCNNGGCLTPLGDPPLFLGYLRGVDFFWTLYLLSYWFAVNLVLILLYFTWDKLWYYPKESQEDKAFNATEKTNFRITGLKVNLPLLLGVILSVAFLSPTNPVPVIGTFLFPENDGHPWYFLREAIQLGLAALSLLLSSHWIRRANAFSFTAILEVAVLFFGIFICMQAPLQILSQEGKNVVAFAQEKTGLNKPEQKPPVLFWTTGVLSCWLDNAPTYVVFFEVSKSLQPKNEAEIERDNEIAIKTRGEPKWKKDGKYWRCTIDPTLKLIRVKTGFIDHTHLIAIALGTVFMGGMTYIANGPNFMVKAIAEQSKVKMPSFFGYMVYSCLILLPLYVVMTIFFL
ncbi:MAG: sodium:proton antiporter [Planctomycetaceae bacterium]|nr:sodium:proton antiporter [Planctomycetaceae bacterium]